VVGDNVTASADGVLSNTVVVVLGSPGGKVGQLVGRAREDTVVGSAAQLVVGLVGGVSGVTEGGNSNDLLAELRVDIKVGRGNGHAVLEESTASTTEDVTNDLGTLRVTADNQLGVGAASAVGVELSDTVGNTLIDGLAVRSLNGVVEKDILVIAVLKAVADSVYELALTTGVGLVVASMELISRRNGFLGSIPPTLRGRYGRLSMQTVWPRAEEERQQQRSAQWREQWKGRRHAYLL
jgi:hypothetical protein